ncbi:MAG TPA: ATP-binding protein [Elusimicrobiota bacterium]|nr:ATP-binding protein [Elusimicrobiota bacterium]
MPPSIEAFESLFEIGRLLSSKLDLDDLLRTILETAARVVGSQSASLLLQDEQTQELYFHVALGLGEAAARVRLKPGQGIAGSVAQSRKGEIISDVREDARWSPETDARSGFVTRSILAVPLVVRGRLLGILEAINKTDGAFTDDDLRSFEAFASQASVAIENARLFSSLKEEKAKLDMVFAEMTDGVILSDPAGRVLLANPAAKRLLGLDSSNTPLTEAWGGFSLSLPLETLLSSPTHASFEARRDAPQTLILGVSTGPFGPADTKTAPAANVRLPRLWIFRDETEDRQKDRLKRTFLSLISHKLRTPLTAVIGYSEMLLGGLEAGKSDPAQQKALEAITLQGRKLADLVDRLVRYVTLESPAGAPRADAPCSLDAAVSEALGGLAERLPSGAALDYKKPAQDPRVLGSREQIIEAVKNLVDNAVKFNAKSAKRVEIKIEQKDGWAALVVSDDGPGIPPEEQEKIFSQFHQVEASFTGQVEGWGLGLPFVKKVAEIHGGRVELDSHLGRGTRVSVFLPALKEEKS